MSSDLTKAPDLIPSLSVPVVQEIAKSDEIPERFIRSAIDMPSATAADELPVIDLKKLLDPSLYDDDELSKLGFACRDWGFFQVINHGISEELIEKVKEDILILFKSPQSEREAIRQLPGQIEGYGQLFVHSDEQKLDWGDALFLHTQPISNRNLRFWPTNPTSFRYTIDKYSMEIEKLANCLYILMAKDLRLDPKLLLEFFSGKRQAVRVNYYPPCKQADKVLGLSPHSDNSGLSVILQANNINGLQVKKNDKWLLIPSNTSSLIIIIGDIMEIMTNGKYKSVEHRAIVNEVEERLSLVTFQFPSLDAVLCPFPDLVCNEKEVYRTISFQELRREYFALMLNGKKSLMVAK